MKHHEQYPPLFVESASGVWLTGSRGKRYLDAISSWWVTLFGHGHRPIVEAIADQAARLDHVLLAGCTHEPAVELAERLTFLAPRNSDGKPSLTRCLFSSDGASAVETAVKLAVHYWRNLGRPRKNRLIKLEGSYHGETAGALSVTDLPIFRNAYEALIVSSETIAVPDERQRRPDHDSDDFIAPCVEAAEALLRDRSDEIAALIVEPLIQCANRMTFYPSGFLTRLRRLCDRHDVLLIADEIAVGMGRTGTMFACESAGIAPDILCLSKGLSGGTLPLSVTLTTEALYDAFYDDDVGRAFLHSHSYSGNPIACRAALATLDCLTQNRQLEINARKASLLTDALSPVARLESVSHFRHRGMIWAFDVAADEKFPRRCAAEGLRRGLLIRPIGPTVYVMPPYLITDTEIIFLAKQLTETVLAALPSTTHSGNPVYSEGNLV